MAEMICEVCPHRCNLQDGEIGLCGARKNINGRIVNLTYGKVSAVVIERIEKKPIFYFRPGSYLLTLASVGCNLKCQYCQNYEISQITAEQYRHFLDLPVKKVMDLLERNNLDGVAFSYNEPLINYEYVRDVFREAKKRGYITVLSTNGYTTTQVLNEIIPVLDAVNVDVKAFTDDFYRKITGGSLAPVLKTVETLVRERKHVELTYLIIPGLNDDEDELRRFAEWVQSLGDIPVHLPRFYPHYKMKDRKPTPTSKLRKIANLLKSYGLTVRGGWEEYFGIENL